MVAPTRSIHILDPCPEEIPEAKGRSAALSGMDGKVIGLLENRKYHADAFLHELQHVLRTRVWGARRSSTRPSSATVPPAPTETIDALVEECDAIIHGIAD